MKWFVIVMGMVWLTVPVKAEPHQDSDVAPEYTDPLVAIVEACQDALALGDTSTAFSIARKIRLQAIDRFSDEPHQLGPLLLLYADAAAGYKDRGALIAYREAIVAYERAFGVDGQELIAPLMRAAREALARKFRVEAFNLFQRTIALSIQHDRASSAEVAVAKTGIASLHLRVSELEAARRYLDAALTVDARQMSALDLGWVYHVSADTYLALENWETADEHYTQAYGYYEAVNKYSRDLRAILRRLIKANHMMGYPERAIKFCQMYAAKRDWGSRMLFDPSNKLTHSHSGESATISVEYAINSECRAIDVVVLKSDGMGVSEVQRIFENAYWLPRFRDGTPVATGVQKVHGFTIAR